MLRVLTIEL